MEILFLNKSYTYDIGKVPQSVLYVTTKHHDLKSSRPQVSCQDNKIPVAHGGVGVGGFKHPPPRNSEGPPKSCQTEPDCENC